MNIIYKIKTLLLSTPFARNLNDLRYEPLSLLYKPEDLTPEYYEKIKNLGDIELEHQIGRLTNFKKILNEIGGQDIKGDFLEFGSWKGFSLLWIAYLSERVGIFNRKIVGMDGFIGLLEDDGEFRRGAFSNTSLRICRRNLQYSPNLYEITKKNIFVEQFLYSEKDVILRRLSEIGCRKFSFVHIDCDTGSAVEDVFKILCGGYLLEDKCYILFDDYGCKSKLGLAVNKWILEMRKNWLIVEHSNTALTKNFCLTRIK